MPRPFRVLLGTVLAAVGLLPAAGLASPTPSPSLATLLADPPATDYLEDTQGLSLEGAFSMDDYIAFIAPANPSQMHTTLQHDGFLSGFGRSWVEDSSNHVLLEVVIAFKGGSGAKQWLSSSETVDKADRFYTHAISVAGLDAYYGVHLADPTTPAYADIISFVKGNDFFLVGLVSGADDLGDAASSQTHRQYDVAPPYTIPPSQWPESPPSALDRVLGLLPVAAYAAVAVVALFLVVAIVLVGGRVARGRSRQPALVGALQLSPDGRLWWDGQAWRDTASEVPPGALRSGDGYYWWDGDAWRLVPPPPAG